MNRFFSLLVLGVVLTCFAPFITHAQELLLDVDQTPVGISPRDFVVVGEHLYFTANGPEKGREWWVTDGSSAGTRLVVDIAPGADGISVSDELALGDRLAFWERGNGQFMMIDHLTHSLQVAKGIPSDRRPSHILDSPQGALLLMNGEPSSVWYKVSNDSGQAVRYDIPCTSHCRASQPVVIGDTLYFQTRTSAREMALWSIDLTDNKPAKLERQLHTYGYVLGAIDSTLLVVDKEGARSMALMALRDGQFGELLQLSTTVIRVHASALGVIDDELVFWLESAFKPIQIYKTNGTKSGTNNWFAPIDRHGMEDVRFLPDGTMVFKHYDGDNGWELWKLNSATLRLEMVKDIRPGRDGSNPAMLQVIGDAVYFCASDGIHGTELWRSDGTPDGTYMVKDLLPGEWGSNPEIFAGINGEILVSNYDPDFGSQLISLNPENGQSRLITWYSSPVNMSSEARDFVQQDDIAFFRARRKLEPYRLWQTGGTLGTTYPVQLPDSAPDSDLRHRIDTESFSLWEYAKGYALRDRASGEWTFIPLLVQGRLGQDGALNHARFAASQNEVLFGPLYAEDGTGDLWITDGTAVGTRPLDGIQGASSLSPVKRAGDSWILVGNSSLYRLDDAGLTSLGYDSSFDNGLSTISTDHTTYFFRHGRNGLWSLDESADHIQIASRSTQSRDGFVRTGNTLLSTGVTYENLGEELTIRTHPDSVRVLVDLNPGPAGSHPMHLHEWEGHAVFTARIDGGDRQLWISDGTASGTHVLVEDLAGAGSEDYFDTFKLLAGDEHGFLFMLRHDTYGREPWYSDGTLDGTVLLADLWPGPDGSRPRYGSIAGDHIVFAAYQPGIGQELFRVSRSYLATDVESGEVPTTSNLLAPGYPNPTRSRITFPMDVFVPEGKQIDVIDVLGRQHVVPLDWSPAGITVDSSRLASGLYFIRVQDGTQVTSRQFVVRH